ncbi:multidrug resistance protein NorM [Photorhabdus temperata]|uniref:Multidrug-efflux transporter n=1 Tax=Photorhabdus khanii NC19 TaxID=1004151 RepID=W3VC47_9GAMM|nr:MATE family efflux transporter [Photorhabdus khanii]ETS33378.1 putative efflux protein, MATE family [Photorhabdus khanii NC19]OHV53915.1 multidrug resistance protein NorM [Photorhabdus temperata]
MAKFSNWQELRQLFLLSFPIIIAQIARTAMGVVDIVMSGHYATADLAAVTLGSSIWFPIFVLGYGTIIMLAADVAKHKAQGNEEGVKESLRNYLFLSMILSIPIILLLMLISKLFSFIGLDDNILDITRGYVIAMAFSVPGVMIFNVFRSFLQGLEDTKVAMYLSSGALLLNIPLNYMLIYGKFGLPEMGGVGAGITTAIINNLSAVCLVVYFLLKNEYRRYRFRLKFPKYQDLLRTFYISIPSGLAFFVEMVFLDVVAVSVAPLGTQTVAAHNIMLNIVTIIYTVITGFATATTVRVGSYIGQRDRTSLMGVIRVSISLVLSISVILGFLIYFFAAPLISLYTNDDSVIIIALSLAFLFCFFQFFDSFQGTLAGILRGFHDTRSVFYAPLFGYWLVGLPLGFILALTDWVTDSMGIVGFWYGLVLGLFVNSVLLSIILKIRARMVVSQLTS